MVFLTPLMYDEHILKLNKKGSIFNNLTFYDQNLHDLKDYQLAIVGADEASLTAFRNCFYNYGDHFQFPILDLGLIDQSKESMNRLVDLSSELPILIIGGKPSDMIGTTAHISKILPTAISNNEIKCIGYQRHLANLDHYNKMDEFQNLSLGELRKNPMMVEPLMRTCQNLSFDLSAIKQGDLGIDADNICGLTLEEASQICRYAGISPGMRLLHFPNLQPQFAFGNMAKEFAECVSTMIWYYMEGLLNLRFESPEEDEHISYVINTEYFEEPLTFLKGEKSGRWWMKYGEGEEFYPCLYEDFMQSRNGNIPDRLYKYCMS